MYIYICFLVYRNVEWWIGGLMYGQGQVTHLCPSPSTKKIDSEYHSPLVVHSRFSIFSIPHLICVSCRNPIWGRVCDARPTTQDLFFPGNPISCAIWCGYVLHKSCHFTAFFFEFSSSSWHTQSRLSNLGMAHTTGKSEPSGKLETDMFQVNVWFSGTPLQLFVTLCVGGLNRTCVRQFHVNSQQALFAREDWYTNFRSSTWFMSIVLEVSVDKGLICTGGLFLDGKDTRWLKLPTNKATAL